METGNPLTLLRFEAAVKVIKSLPPDGKDDLHTGVTAALPEERQVCCWGLKNDPFIDSHRHK